MKRLIVAIVAATALGASAADRFAYKGRLAKADGEAFNTALPMAMTFRLYGAATGGQVLWGRTMPVKMKADGSFSVELGDNEGSAAADARYAALGDALAASPGGVWIGLAPQSYSEMSPRQRLNPVPRALTAATAAKADVLAARKVVADTLNVECESLVGTLSVPAGGSIRQSSRDAAVTLSASGERTLSAGGEIRVTGAIKGITMRYLVTAGGTARSDMIVLWRGASGISGNGWSALVVPKGTKMIECYGDFNIATAIGKGN